MPRLSDVSDDELLHGLHRLAGAQRGLMAELVHHLAEVDARRLYANEGFPSLFSYCVEALSFSEDEACRRIEAARLARKFPLIYELLRDGSVTLTVVVLLKPHLTQDNHVELLASVSGSNVRRAKEWIAARFPQPDVPSSIRKHPERRLVTRESPALARIATDHAIASPTLDGVALRDAIASPPLDAAALRDAIASPRLDAAALRDAIASPRLDAAALRDAPLDRGTFEHATASPPLNAASPRGALSSEHDHPGTASLTTPTTGARRGRVEPLSRDRFLLKVTVSRTLKEKLDLARDLTSHGNPSGDLEMILERALDALLERLEKTKLGGAIRHEREGRPTKPRQATKPRRPAKRTHVANGTRREVVLRDGLRCSFVAPDGRLCGARAFLEFDHEKPRGLGGNSEPDNVRLLCRAHNRLAAERVYGTAHVRRAAARARPARAVVTTSG